MFTKHVLDTVFNHAHEEAHTNIFTNMYINMFMNMPMNMCTEKYMYIHVKEHLVHRQGHVHIYVHIHKHEHAKTCVSILKNKHVHCTSYSTVGAGPNGCYVSYEFNR